MFGLDDGLFQAPAWRRSRPRRARPGAASRPGHGPLETRLEARGELNRAGRVLLWHEPVLLFFWGGVENGFGLVLLLNAARRGWASGRNLFCV